MSASNDNGHIYVEIKLRRHRQRGHPAPTTDTKRIRGQLLLLFKHLVRMTPLFQTCLNTPSKRTSYYAEMPSKCSLDANNDAGEFNFAGIFLVE